ncbi:hypothetical protein GHT06_003860 [Daphnia sinensis]|uniref:Uncharacterized protein n=1 Tax=Daphnia sinensis TaxID=1820382 RepID=A0AAD5PM28_9CRUS|nr:hypothetical protein GHT06_003860 [Daphnia sinensis]
MANHYVISRDLDLQLLRYLPYEETLAYGQSGKFCRAVFLVSLRLPWSRVRVSAVHWDTAVATRAMEFVRQMKPQAVELSAYRVRDALAGDWVGLAMPFRSLNLRAGHTLNGACLAGMSCLVQLEVRSGYNKRYGCVFTDFSALPPLLTRLDMQLCLPKNPRDVDLRALARLVSVVIDYGRDTTHAQHKSVSVHLPATVEDGAFLFGRPNYLTGNAIAGLLRVDAAHCTRLKTLTLRWPDTVWATAPTGSRVCAWANHVHGDSGKVIRQFWC